MSIDELFAPAKGPEAWCIYKTLDNKWTIGLYPVKRVYEEDFRCSHDYSTTTYYYQPSGVKDWVEISKSQMHTSEEDAKTHLRGLIENEIDAVQKTLDKCEYKLNMLLDEMDKINSKYVG